MGAAGASGGLKLLIHPAVGDVGAAYPKTFQQEPVPRRHVLVRPRPLETLYGSQRPWNHVKAQVFSAELHGLLRRDGQSPGQHYGGTQDSDTSDMHLRTIHMWARSPWRAIAVYSGENPMIHNPERAWEAMRGFSAQLAA